MSRIASSWRTVAIVATVSCLAPGDGSMPGAAQASEGVAPKALGVASCASSLCHGSAKPLETRGVLQNEYVTWSHFDPHARAYRALLEPLGVAIARRMGLPAAHEAPECLACHTHVVAPAARGERFQASDGVGCETCHGAAERWIAGHYREPRQRAESLAQGLAPLEDPKVLAEVCLGCHVGSAGRFATHEMMAAGHPRLAFELDTYTELWRTSGGREHFRRDADYEARKRSASALEVWSTGLIAATGRSIALIEQHAGVGGALPDFALYNCYSCHRAMQVSSWAGQADPEHAPGSLRLQDGHARALLEVAHALDAPRAASFRDALREMRRAAGGDREAAGRAARDLAAILDALERWAQRRSWSPRDAERALEALANAARNGAFTDYAAAEQAAMSMVVLLAEAGAGDRRLGDVDRLFGLLANDTAFDAQRFARALEAFGAD
jgi:hypothetical protein